jgi:hypothetical protein
LDCSFLHCTLLVKMSHWKDSNYPKDMLNKLPHSNCQYLDCRFLHYMVLVKMSHCKDNNHQQDILNKLKHLNCHYLDCRSQLNNLNKPKNQMKPQTYQLDINHTHLKPWLL